MMSENKLKILFAVSIALLGVYSFTSTKWINDVFRQIYEGEEIQSSAAFFALTNVSSALSVFVCYIVLNFSVNRIIIYSLIFASLVSLNAFTIIYLLNFIDEFSDFSGQNIVMSVISLLTACLGGGMLAVSVVMIISIFKKREQSSDSK